MELRPKAQLFVQIWNCNTMIPSFLRQKNSSNWIVKDVPKKKVQKREIFSILLLEKLIWIFRETTNLTYTF